MTNQPKLGLLRLVAQHIAGERLPSAAAVVRHMTAMQAQDYGGALTAIALRIDGGKRGDVEIALDNGEIVRSWPMRGTLHFVASQDLSWMLGLTTARIIAGATTRHSALGFDDAQFARARDIAVEVLHDSPRLTRDDFLASFSARGFDVSGQRAYHTIWYLAQTGVICFGPVRGNQQQLVLVDDWIKTPRTLERDEALAEWVFRYFTSHGPASVKDFVRWSGLRVSDVRLGLSLVQAQLARITVEGIDYFMDVETPDRLAKFRRVAKGVFLLPGFDEFVLGYGDRNAIVAPEFAARIVPGGNGMFKPTVVSDGRVVGTWKPVGSGPGRRVEAAPFVAFSAKVAEGISRAGAALP
ncbi:MAG: winged helix DNA-binding domain-containing protein [Acidothermaceae bacterium]